MPGGPLSGCGTAQAAAGYFTAPVRGRGERLRLSLAGTAAASLAANAFSYFNFIPQHDALIEGFWQNTDWVIALGRFLLPGYRALVGNIPMPWTAGMLSMLYLALAVYCITDTLAMGTRAEILFTGGFLAANLSVLTINALFQFVLDAYLCAFFLACAGVWLLSDAAGPGRIAGAAACFFLSVGIYPAMITGALCLFLLRALRQAAEENALTPALWKKLGCWVLALGLAAGLYLLCSRLALSLRGIAGADKDTSVFSLGDKKLRDILYGMGINIYFFAGILFLGVSPVHGTKYLGPWYGAAASALAVICVVSFCRRNRGKLRGRIFGLFFLGAAVFPVLARLVNIMAESGTAHHTAYAQFLAYPALLWAFFFSRKKGEAGEDQAPAQGPGKLSAAAVIALSLIIVLANVRFSNEAYTLQKVLYDRAAYHTGQVAEDLLEAGYDPDEGDLIVVGGTFSLGGELSGKLDRISQTGMFGFYDTSVTYHTTFRSMARLLGVRVNMTTVDATADPEALGAAMAQMPAYPKEGYLQKSSDGLFIIKLS